MTAIALDFETTSTNIVKDRIIQYSFVKLNFEYPSFEIIEKKKGLLSLPDGSPQIHPKAFEAHGISEAMLVGKPTFAQIAPKIKIWLDNTDFLLGYNLKGFDIPLLIEEFGRCGIVYEPKPIIDSCIIFKKREERTLSAAYRFYTGNEPLENAHDAEVDVLMTLEVLRGQVQMYGLDKYIRLLGESDEIIKTPEPLENVLISESKYDGEDLRLSFDGLIVSRESDGIACWSDRFGKNKGKPVLEDRGYCDWFLSADFPYNTKNVLRSLLNSK